MNDSSAEGIVAPSGGSRSPESAELARALGVGTDTAETLIQAGYTSVQAVRELSQTALELLGVATSDVERIRRPAPATTSVDRTVENDQIVQKWVGTVRRVERPRRPRVAIPTKDSTDTLRKWVEGDDSAMEEWIHSSEPVRAETAPSIETLQLEEARRARPAEPASAPTSEREETVVRWLMGLLDRVKSDQFDPATMIQEAQDLHRQLYDERTKRKQLEDEIEHVKRGSIAVIKYVRSHEAKEKELALRSKDDEIAELRLRLLALEGAEARSAPSAAPVDGSAPVVAPQYMANAIEKATRELDARLREEFAEREHAYIERETELRRRTVQLESEVRNLRSDSERSRERDELLAAGGSIPAEVDERLQLADQREKDLVTRENELRQRFEEIRINAEEVERRKSPLEFKERELASYDQQLQTRKQALDIEARRLEELRREVGGSGAASASEESRRMEDLKHMLNQKEEELRAREGALRERMITLEAMAGKAAEADAGQMHEDAVRDVAEVKVKTGVRRLDDLLFGGFPAGAQVLVNGPAHTGKDVLARLFSVEGLKLGIPSIWVVTDKTWNQVRDDLIALYPKYEEAEKNGMLRYVDLYSRSVGSSQTNPGVRLLSATDKGVLDQLAQTVNGFSEELKEKFPTYRVIFESVSTVTAYLDSTSTFRFLQPFIGRRKIDLAVGYYILDRGMHSDADLETLEHMVDGSVNLKIEQLKTFLAVKGIGEAQSRAWIGYTFTKRSLNLGSFSLDHIR
ncbi:MAG: ATPase domain-containing protein [Thermoplasmata archaeon]